MLFGSCEGGVVRLNEIGQIVRSSWVENEHIREGLVLDEFIIMPNHLHGIVHLPATFAAKSLFAIVGGFKSQVTSSVRVYLRDASFVVWQKRFHDRIIRTQRELELMREYIRANPARWGL